MQDLFGKLEQKWGRLNAKRKGHPFGINLRTSGRAMTTLRFADDVLLVAQSKADVAKMLAHVSEEAQAYGLKLNFEKTKVLTWNHYRQGIRNLLVNGEAVEVLGEDSAER